MSDLLSQLKEKLEEVLPQVTQIIGYKRGFNLLHVTPLFICKPADIEQLIWDEFCIHNLANYLAPQKQLLLQSLKEKEKIGKLLKSFDSQSVDQFLQEGMIIGEKIGIILKGCDSRSVNQLLQEGVVKREQLLIIGLPCEGKIDLRKLKSKVNVGKITQVQVKKQAAFITGDQNQVMVNLDDILYDKCLACDHPNPIMEDIFVGHRATKERSSDYIYQPVLALEKLPLAELYAFWQNEFARCIRCHACRNACPMCYCMHQCLITTRKPHWISEKVAPKENEFFHIMRALHLAGRCTNCGECARVCPINIPIDLLTRKTNMILLELFNYRAGIDPKIKPPLVTYTLEESWETKD